MSRAEVEHDSGCCEHGDAHEEEAALIVAGEVFGEADPVGANEAADDADRVHGSDAGGGGAALEEAGRERPKRTLHGVVCDDDETEGWD